MTSNTPEFKWSDYFSFQAIRDAHTGKCCMNCMAYPKDKPLLQCGNCRQVKYCSKACQLEHWKKAHIGHKQQCKLIKKFKDNYHSLPGFTLFSKCKIIEDAKCRALKENPTCKDAPTNIWANGHLRFFIMKGKSCAICNVNEYSSGDKQLDWICCKVCNAGWCCSEKHWKKYKRKHTAQICHSYQQNTALELFQWNHMKKYDEDFKHFPEETLPTRLTTFPSSWDEYFLLRFKEMYIMGHQQGYVPPEFFPCSTRILSQGVTALYGMYEHGIEKFADKSTLTVHIVGADKYESPPTCVWEEILHCLPNITNLACVLIGPEATQPGRDMMAEVECCPTCQSNNRSRFIGLYSSTYHDHYNKYKTEPDFIVAHNTGLYEEDTESWKESIKVMLDMNVPCFFTSYNSYEATEDVATVKSLGAKMLYKDGLKENPFKDLCPMHDTQSDDKFYHNNMYCYGFKGYE